MRKFIALFTAITFSFLQSCSTIVHGGSDSVVIKSRPSGAMVSVGGRMVETPATVRLKGKSQYLVTAEKPGYKDGYATIDSEFRIASTILGNIFWLLIGVVVDFSTGAMYDLDDEVTVKLKKK